MLCLKRAPRAPGQQLQGVYIGRKTFKYKQLPQQQAKLNSVW